MLSRVAHNIYWMQRYRERTENLARIREVNLILSTDLPEEQMDWEALLFACAAMDEFKEIYGSVTQPNIVAFFTFERNNPGSLINCIRMARENARSVRDAITTEMWQELNTIYLYAQNESLENRTPRDPYHFFNRIKRQCQLFTGIADTTMSHGLAWHFGRIGYLIERADMTTRLLDVKYFTPLPGQEMVGGPFDNIQWNALLKSVSGLEMYRKKWRNVHYTHVIEFLILDREFPRSIHSCLTRCLISLSEVDERTNNAYIGHAEEAISDMLSYLNRLDHAEIIRYGLHEFIERIQAELNNIHTAIFDAFFNKDTEIGPLSDQ
ncbi:MAG: alpha-E domain-containing protein [Candidatus Omnitrophica bacterium]|nr:alpha-E domain-containing protein [Candidatus Omnitrophota bacterium]